MKDPNGEGIASNSGSRGRGKEMKKLKQVKKQSTESL